jgi:LysM repeat protein
MKKYIPILFTIMLTLSISFSPWIAHANSDENLIFSTAAELIDAVNALRLDNGLPPYQPNSTLMNLAQEHAEYMASIGMSNIHIDSRGFLPFQRALAAGYPVAGDIYSNVGLFSENVTGGVGKTAQEAVTEWMGDAPHLGTMLSPDLRDVGAGVAIAGNTFYYCLDAGQSTGGTPLPFTPPPSYNTPAATMIPNTPNADGSIEYIIQRGDTALGIALNYGITLNNLLSLNGLTEKTVIFPGQKLLIRPSFTSTPTRPTSTPTKPPTITPWPTKTLASTNTLIPPTPLPSSGLPVSTARFAVFLIVFSALIIAGLLVLLGRKRK